MEEWRKLDGIVECGENYAVSTHGNVMNIATGRVLKPRVDLKGYYDVGLSNGGRSKQYKLHRLVALAFLENQEKKPQVNHIDGVKTNNLVNNLEWSTNSENQIHALKMGLANNERQTEMLIKFNSKSVIQFDLCGNEIGWFSSAAEASRNTDMLEDTIRCQCRNKTKPRFRPYYFRFADEQRANIS